MKKQVVILMFLFSFAVIAFPKLDSNDYVMIVIKDYIKNEVRNSEKIEIIWSSPIIKNSDETWAQAVKLKIKNSDSTPINYCFIISEDNGLKVEKMLPITEFKEFQKNRGVKVSKVYSFEGKVLSKLKLLTIINSN